MPAISHYALLILIPGKRENLSKVLTTSVVDFSFLRKKKWFHSHKKSIRMYDENIVGLQCQDLP